VFEDGRVIGRPGWEMTFYRPFLIECRGWDERTTYYNGEDAYGRWIMEKIYHCKQYIPKYYFLAHRHHEHKNNNKISPKKLRNLVGNINIRNQIRELSMNVKGYRKNVNNTYW
jgi:hypothetical protein